MSRVLPALLCSALLCSALLCSAVSIWRLFHPCQPLFTSFFKILGKAKPQLYRRKAAIPTREISRRFPADRLQLADPMGPCSFAPPACAGFAELNSYFTNIEYTKMNILSSRKYAKRQYTWFNNQMNVTWFDVNFNDFNKIYSGRSPKVLSTP